MVIFRYHILPGIGMLNRIPQARIRCAQVFCVTENFYILMLFMIHSFPSVLHAFTQYIQPAGQHLIIRFTSPEPLRINLMDLV